MKIYLAAVVESPTPILAAKRLVAGLLEDLGRRPAVRSQLVQGQAVLATLAGGEEGWRLLDTAHEIERDLGRSSSWGLRITGARMHLLAGDDDSARRILAASGEVHSLLSSCRDFEHDLPLRVFIFKA